MKPSTERTDSATGTDARAEYPIDTIGVIGHGFVGKAVARAFKGYTDVKVWDRRPERATRQLSCRWDYVVEAVLADERIGRSHHLVPGPDGKAGFGSNLLKDLPALIATAEDLGVNAHVLIGAWHRNAESRSPVLGPGIGTNF